MVLFSKKFKVGGKTTMAETIREEFCARLGRIHGNSSIVSEKWGVKPMKEW